MNKKSFNLNRDSKVYFKFEFKLLLSKTNNYCLNILNNLTFISL